MKTIAALANKTRQAYASHAALLHSIFMVSGMRAASMLMAFVTSIILARSLSPDGYGVYAYIFSIISLLALPVHAGLPELLVRQTAAYLHDNKIGLMAGLIRRSHQVVFWLSIPITLLLVAVAASQTNWEGRDKWLLLAIASPLILITALKGLRTGILQGLHKFKASQIPETLVRPAAFLALVLALFALGSLDVLTALVSQIIAVTLALFVGIWLLKKELPEQLDSAKPEYEDKAWRKSALPFVQMSLVGTFNAQLVTVFLGLISTDADIGIYRVASLMAGLLAIVYSVTSMAIMPKIVAHHKSRDMHKLQHLATVSARVSLLCSLALGAVLLFAGQPLLLMLFGAEYQASYAGMIWIAAGQVVNAALGFSGQMLNMTGNERYTLTGQLLGLTSITAFSAALIPFYGATGGAIATSIGLVSWNLFLYFKAWRITSIDTCAVRLFAK